MGNLDITKRHKRLLSSLFFVLEQKTEAIEHMIGHSKENASYIIEQDLSNEQKENISLACKELKESLFEISNELDLSIRKISQAQYISTIQSQMWENISDVFSDKLKGYGEEVKEAGRLADPFIQQIADRIDKLKL